MKKLFTIFVAFAAMLAMNTASAGTPFHAEKKRLSQSIISEISGQSLRSASCTQITNLNFNTADTNVAIYTDAGGYLSGNDSILYQGQEIQTLYIGEKFDAPAGTGRYVSKALVFFGVIVINPNHADSAALIKAYVYDTTGTSPVNGYAPGHAIDSASVTLGSIAGDTAGTAFTFNNVLLPATGFFITISLPKTVGDTLAILTNDGSTGNGNGWLEQGAAGQTLWERYDSSTGGQLNLGNYIFPTVCGSVCPTITVTATQIGNSSKAFATATGGVAPYSYKWSNNEITDTATALHTNTYTVTASDNNGCTGTASVSVTTGIESIGDISNFNVYPNPSNGAFTASIHLTVSSDVTVSIIDITGNKVYETTENAIKDLDKQISLGTIAPGIYFVSLKTAQGTANQRIIIK